MEASAEKNEEGCVLKAQRGFCLASVRLSSPSTGAPSAARSVSSAGGGVAWAAPLPLAGLASAGGLAAGFLAALSAPFFAAASGPAPLSERDFAAAAGLDGVLLAAGLPDSLAAGSAGAAGSVLAAGFAALVAPLAGVAAASLLAASFVVAVVLVPAFALPLDLASP